MGALQACRLFLLDEAGYGDSWVLYDVLHFQRSGVIYRDLTQPPYLPAVYSPTVYMMYAVPREIAGNPFLGPRLIALASFVLCVAVTVSLVRALIPVRFAWLWGLLIAGSIRSMELWPLQLRGDFPAIFFGLLSIRLLSTRSRHLMFLAGICAGLPLQFKISYLAPLVAGSLWLLLRKEWKGLGIFVAAGALASIGLYVFFWLREPRMVPQILSLFPPVRDVVGCLKLILKALGEPVALLALIAVPFVILRAWPRWQLLLLFVSVSFLIAAVTDLQVGGNVNYFFEGLFALTPLAVFGSFRLIAWSRRRGGLTLLAAVLVSILWLSPSVLDKYHEYGQFRDIDPRGVVLSNRRFRMIDAVLRGRHFLTTEPRIALFDPQPPLLDPFLLSYLRRLGKFDAEPLLSSIRNGEFEFVLGRIGAESNTWRGIRRLEGDDFKIAVETAYRPECSLFGEVLRVPRNRVRDESLIQQLHDIGCVPE